LRLLGSRKPAQNVQLAELALSQMKLCAPISGIVSRPLVKEGAYITKEARDQSRLATVASATVAYSFWSSSIFM
jgi:multidrug resistance efflux pump